MGFFPFLAPFSPWIKQVMEDREANPELSILQKNPFAVLSSAALVVNGGPDIYNSDMDARSTTVLELIENPGDSSYKGCIIASNISDLELSYSINETPVGIDFTGKVIKVQDKSETGRRVSTPIIESIDIDTDGANNTLKTAKINVRCFTLKQLEMFELFFMKPGMNVLLEYGDSTLKYISNFKRSAQPGETVTKTGEIYKTYVDGTIQSVTLYPNIEEALVQKKDYNTFCKNDFYQYFRSDKKGQNDYITRVEKSIGSYDLVAGKVTEFGFSIDKDGTYQANIEISQGNQLSLAIPHSKPNQQGKTPAQPKDIEFSSYDQIIELIVADMNLDKNKLIEFMGKKENLPEHGGKWSVDFFNFLKVNKEQKDTIASSDAYISLRFILKILMNYIIADGNVDDKFFKLKIPVYKVGGKDIEIIPTTSHKNMLSSSDEVLFPRNKLPIIEAPTETEQKKGKNEEKLNPVSSKDGRIGEKDIKLDFHVEKEIEIDLDNQIKTFKPDLGDGEVLANALNIFVKYETVVKYWKSTYTRIDFLEKILNVVNKNGYGLYTLVAGCVKERGDSSIFDYRFAPQRVKEESEIETYRFKPTTIKSICKDFSFNFEMSSLVAGRTIFNSGKFLALAKQKNKGVEVGKLPLPPEAYKAVDNSTFGNADGWYSINKVEYERISENFQKAQAAEASGSKVQTSDQKPEESTNSGEQLSDIIKSKSVNFIINEDSPKGKMVVLVYKDNAFMRKQIDGEEMKKNKPTVSPVTVTITVDGFSGFRCGQYFKVDGIPEIYNRIGVFQITNTKHNISKDGWTTTIEADHRIIKQTK